MKKLKQKKFTGRIEKRAMKIAEKHYKTMKVEEIVNTHIEEHSKKTAIVRDKIVELVGDMPRIELFARQTVDGWDCWGNEVQL